MVLYTVELADRLASAGVAVVVGYQGEQVKAAVEAHWATHGRPPLLFAEQTEQLGTGHAVMQAREAFARAGGGPAARYVILSGDTPLLCEATVRELLLVHQRERATVTVLTAILEDPSGYGRVVRSGQGGRRVLKIVEDRDATVEEQRLREINVGTYVVEGPFLFEALDKLEPQNAQKEYYLTDIIALAVERGLPVSAVTARDAGEVLGINSRRQLAEAERVVRGQICARWMDEGVTMRDPATTVIDADVTIGRDTVLYPYVTLEGRTVIGEDCVVRSHSRITDSTLGHRVLVQDSCVLREAKLEDDTTVGPFAHLRPGSVLRRAAKVGNFVEMKKADLGEASKANHLTYLGDARIGRKVNIGAGTITCNYDGIRKSETIIEDEVFVGSDTQFIAPVTVGRGAIVAAGSTITNEVPPDALAIARATQVNRPGWAARRRALSSGVKREGSPVAPGVQRAPDVKRGATADPLTSHASRLTKGRSSNSAEKVVPAKRSGIKKGAKG
jgi:bifunctional UDP-N-acetylglucosamine pyrophosphorylase/glucosamine-1-phosphate N-acetyltransferase